MKLYIGRNMYNTRDQTFDYLGEAEDAESIERLIKEYIDNNGISSYYQRWTADHDFDGKPMWMIDYGSYSRFIYIYDLTGETLERWKKLTKECYE